MKKRITRTQEIAKLLNISESMAVKVREEMDNSGIDYSECEQDEFDSTARRCLDMVNSHEKTS